MQVKGQLTAADKEAIDMLKEVEVLKRDISRPSLHVVFREEGQRRLADLEERLIDHHAVIAELLAPRFDYQRLTGACIDGPSVESIDTDGQCGLYRVCGSLALNEDQRYTEVLPAREQ